jgi:hypothetical protein
MTGNPLFEKPEGISWNPASVDLPPLPSIQAGEDSMSATISAAIPALHAEMTASVSTLQAKEGMFSSKVLDAQSAYQNADDAGSQSVGQMGSQMGQMAQQAAGAASKAGESGGGGGVFGQLMEQAMKAVQGMTEGVGGQSGEGAEGQGAQGQQPAGMAGAPPAGQSSGSGGGGSANSGEKHEGGSARESAEPPAPERDEHQPTERAPLGQPPAAAAGPGDRQHVAGPAPVAPPASSRGAEPDLSRNL